MELELHDLVSICNAHAVSLTSLVWRMLSYNSECSDGQRKERLKGDVIFFFAILDLI